MSLNQELLRFVRSEVAAGGDDATIDENTQLIDSGVIDSMALMRLIAFVEERANVRIPDEEVLPENFQSISDIESLVDRLTTRP